MQAGKRLFNGKANKAALLRPLVEQELARGGHDWQAVLGAAKVLLAHDFDPDERAGVVLKRKEVEDVVNDVRRQQRKLSSSSIPTGIPHRAGKVDKRSLLRGIIEEQRRKGLADDRARFREIAMARLAQAGVKGVAITKTDINNAILSIRRARSVEEARLAPASTAASALPAAPAADSWGAAELRAGSALLLACGKSVARAKEVLSLVANLQNGA